MKADIFDLLKTDPTTAPVDANLPIVGLWRPAVHYLMFFTLVPERFASHYDPDRRFGYLCPGDGCPACDAGERPTVHIYLPAWDAQNRRIVALRFDTRADGPAPKILTFLRTYQGRLAEIVAVFDCRGNGEFTITAHAPLPETDRGALACRAFCDGLESGAVDLRDCVRRLTAEEIAALPTIRRKATRLVGDPVAPAPPAPVAGAPVEGEGGAA